MNRLKKLRKEFALTQVELAKLIGSSQQTISRAERSNKKVPAEILYGASKFFNVTIEYLTGESDERNSCNVSMDFYGESLAKTGYGQLSTANREIIDLFIHTLLMYQLECEDAESKHSVK